MLCDSFFSGVVKSSLVFVIFCTQNNKSILHDWAKVGSAKGKFLRWFHVCGGNVCCGNERVINAKPRAWTLWLLVDPWQDVIVNSTDLVDFCAVFAPTLFTDKCNVFVVSLGSLTVSSQVNIAWEHGATSALNLWVPVEEPICTNDVAWIYLRAHIVLCDDWLVWPLSCRLRQKRHMKRLVHVSETSSNSSIHVEKLRTFIDTMIA